MAQKTRAQLKAYFETGDIPTQAEFADFIDSIFNILDDSGVYVDGEVLKIKGGFLIIQNADRTMDYPMLAVPTANISVPTPTTPTSDVDAAIYDLQTAVQAINDVLINHGLTVV